MSDIVFSPISEERQDDAELFSPQTDSGEDRLQVDRGEIEQFFKILFRHATRGYVSFRCFTQHGKTQMPRVVAKWHKTGEFWPNGKERRRAEFHSEPVGNAERVVRQAVSVAQCCAGHTEAIVFCPPICTFTNPLQARGEDIDEALDLTVECDNYPAAARRRISDLLGAPTLAMTSGGFFRNPENGADEPKVHLHYRLAVPARSALDHRKLNYARNLAARISGADTSATNAVHPLRWAGSWHRKTNHPVMARIVEINESAEIDLDAALAVLQAAARELNIATRDPASDDWRQGEASVASDQSELLEAFAAIPNDCLSWDEWNGLGMALYAATDASAAGAAAWVQFSKKAVAKYDEDETENRWRHYETSPPSKVGAGTIYHHANKAGWICKTGYDQFLDDAKETWRMIKQIRGEHMDQSTENPEDTDTTINFTMEDDDEEPVSFDEFAEQVKEDEKPAIVQIEPGQLSTTIDNVESALIKSNLPVYQRDGQVVRIGEFPVHKGRAGLAFVEIGPETMVELLTKIIPFEKYDGRSKEAKRINCPKEIASTYLARIGHWNLPVIRAIITAPTLRPDGTVLNTPGFDEATGIYFDPQGVKFPAVPDQPTREVARELLDWVIEFVAEMPFVEDEEKGQINRSVFLAAFLTALIRTALPAAPLFGFNAPVAGAGKSKLVNAIVSVMTGYPVQHLAQGDEEETEKRLSSALQAGSPVISFDNCEEPLQGQLLCQAITEPVLSLRVLGKSELRKTSNTAMYYATGNNLTIIGDLARRSLRCTIDPQCENPELREFKTLAPDVAVMQERPGLIVAVLTILRAFWVAKRPRQTKPLGSFEDWSRTVRDCLIWLGEPDPCETMELIRQDDPEREKAAAALHAWFEAFEDEEPTSKDVVDRANERTDGSNGTMPRYTSPILRDSLVQLSKTGLLTTKSLGDWIRYNKDRWFSGYMIVKVGVTNKMPRWKVIK